MSAGEGDTARSRARSRPRLRRDDQQWIFDYVVKETGAVYHWWSDGAGTLPKSVRSHAMIPKQLGRQAQRIEALADVERAAGHDRTALDLYFGAAKSYLGAQHAVLELNDEKRFLYAGLRRCYEQVRALSPYRIEALEIPWEGTVVSGYLHLRPGGGKAPLLFYVPGCDTTCESAPSPLENLPQQRGMHVFSFDGPGLGASNMRGIRLTADNFERAASAALDALLERPEIDADRVVAYGGGMGSFWAMRFAAHDHRVKAIASKSSYGSKDRLMDQDSPRYKQLFAFLTQSRSEEELDAVMAEMTMDGFMEKIACPVLMAVGEYDLRDPLDEVYRLFDALEAPGELWVFSDQFHKLRLAGGGDTVYALMLDWLVDRLAGKAPAHPGETLYLEAGGKGPNDPAVPRKRRWFE
ncbi:MAG TPA: alpha/beta hydrolase [Candidatus Limnocylindria bacterium]|nr:alpha/beta hydrolase [Candidatus Limnocylindria bacterium]